MYNYIHTSFIQNSQQLEKNLLTVDWVNLMLCVTTMKYNNSN